MANFESGVSAYIKGTCTIIVNFPIDLSGKSHICCAMCPHFAKYDNKCKINNGLCHFPDKYVSATCPLEITGEVEEEQK